MSKTSLTEAGQANSRLLAKERRDALIDAINQSFTLFRVNFHNQYYKAYADDGALLSQAKKLWFESLKCFAAEDVLNATKKIIEEQEYLPTLHQMLRHCAQAKYRAPSVRQAYIEACNATSPKAEYRWSHPAIYQAGRASDWFFLATTPEQFALPVFRNHYEALLDQLGDGRQIDLPEIAVDDKTAEPSGSVSKKQGLQHLNDLKKSLDL